MEWSYGVTTVPARRKTTLPGTLASLVSAGFDRPRLFVDGLPPADCAAYAETGLEVTARWPVVRAYGNWVLSLWELYLRNPTAARFAIFEDDILVSRNVREYLEASRYPRDGYLNLYTNPKNHSHANGQMGWYRSDQLGKGALALVFDRAAIVALLGQQYFIGHPQNAKRGWRWTDGAVVTSMRNLAFHEWVHSPSLVQHIGRESALGTAAFEEADSFRGVAFDAMGLVPT